MFKTILVPGMNSANNSSALELGLQIARRFDGHIKGLHVHPDARELSRYTASLDAQSSMFIDQIWNALVDADKVCAARSHKVFDAFCTKEHLSNAASDKSRLTAAWQEVSGNSRDEIVAEAHYSDLVVFARPQPPEDLTSIGVADILLGSGKPLLLAPSHVCTNPITSAVIAWKGTTPSARTVAAAMPLLSTSQTIHILCIAEGDEDPQPLNASSKRLGEYLRWHGLTSHVELVHSRERDACDVLLESAHQKLSGGLLVMGGYGHSRARELIFGGFTRHVLRTAPLPVFLCH